MAYKIIISPRTQKEIENAIDFYKLYSDSAPLNFIENLQEAYNSLALNPHYKVRYKNIRSIKLNKFPHSLFFSINEKNKLVKVLSCFHNKRNPKKRP